MTKDVAPPLPAPQHGRGPRPLPLFLDLVRRAGERDPTIAAQALAGLARYQASPQAERPEERPVLLRHRGAALRDCGGEGPPLLLVPSLINPPNILDLDERCSLASSLSAGGRVLLLDWGAAQDRRDLDIGGHVTDLLCPLLAAVGEPAVLAGYCLGGTMALGAAALAPVRGVATLASPWRFAAYPSEARQALADLWVRAAPASQNLGVLPIELLQAAFWSLDPDRVVAKYARLGQLAPDSDEARRFVMLEDWANSGEPLPLPAARELIEDFFGRDVTGQGGWRLQGRAVGSPCAPTLHFTAANDRIVPTESAFPGRTVSCPAGHVGMVVGSRAKDTLHQPLTEWVEALGKPG